MLDRKYSTDCYEHGGSITDQQQFGKSPKPFGYDAIHHFVCGKLAEIRGVGGDTLEQEITGSGEDSDMDSEEGAAIAYGLEGTVGRELVKPQDLKPENFTSVKRLSNLLYKNIQEPSRKLSR